MKKRWISLLLAAVMLVSLLPASVFAADNDGSFAEYRIKTNGSWGSWTSVSDGATLKSAINDKSDITVEIYMNCDWNLKTDWTRTVLWSTYGDRITIGSNSDVTIHMRGHVIDRGLTSSEDYANVFSLGAGAKLTLIGSESDAEAGIEHIVKDYASNTNGSVTKTVTGGTLTGCYSKPTLEGQGGAIYFGGSGASVVLQNVTIAGNYFKNNGSGVRFNAESCSLSMDNSKILYNYGGGYGGGVVCEDSNSCSLVMDNGSEISYNAASYGGGVYINNDSFTLAGDGTAKICGNKASSDGGGIYYNDDACNVSGCIIDGNTASGNGGGLYCNAATLGSRAAGLGACTVTNNTAASGGGIYVEEDVTLTLSGVTTIEDNHNTGNADSNLYLESGALLDLQNDTRSVIHFGVQSPSNNLQLSTAAGTYAEFNYFYDGSGYHAKWYDDVASNDSKYRFLYLVTGDAEVIPDPTAVGLEDKIAQSDHYIVDGTAYNLFASYFTFSVITDAENDLDSICYYTDGYFFNDPTVYNEHLCTMSAALMAAGYYTNRGKVGTFGYETATETQYYNKHASLRQLLANIGCADDTIYVNQFNLEQPGMDSIGFGMAHKALETADGTDTGYILVPVSIRGSGYEAEWTSNVTIGPNGEHLGFAVAANTVYSEILNYIANYGLTKAAQQGKLIFWVTGYSRSGATANLTAKRLIDHQSPALTFSLTTNTTLDATALAGVSDDGFGANKVFCYTFEAAQGGTDAAEQSADKTVYYAIHNVLNKADAVPYVGPTEMGFKRYGVDHYLPGSAAGAVQTTVTNVSRGASGDTTVTTYRDNDYYAVGSSEYQAMRSAAVAHMAAVNPYMIFDDYFTTATLNWVGGNLPSWMPSWLGKKDLNTVVSSNVSVETYLEELMAHLQEWGISGRTWFATEPVEINGTTYSTFQQALRDVFEALYSMPDGSGGLLNGLDMSGFSIPYSKIYDLYYNVIRGWYNQTDSKKEELLTWVWDEVISTSGLLDSFTDTQIDNLHQAWPTIADPLLTILSRDYNDETLVSGTGQVYLGTLLYNVNRILNNHFAETLFGWLRASDSYYTTKSGSTYTASETTRYAITAPASVAMPTADTTGKTTGFTLDLPANAGSFKACYGPQRVHFDVTGIAGEAIYYQIVKDGSDYTGANQLFEQYIELSEDGNYTITAYAMSYGVSSAVGTYQLSIGKPQEYTLDESEAVFAYTSDTTNDNVWENDASADHYMGSAKKLTVNKGTGVNNFSYGANVEFTFTGTGFRLYTDTSCRSGMVMVSYTYDNNGTPKTVKKYVSLYRGYTGYTVQNEGTEDETIVWTTVASDSEYASTLYHQIPAISLDLGTSRTYTVKIAPYYAPNADPLQNEYTEFLIDSVTFLGLPDHDTDYSYTNLRDAVVSANSLISLDVLYVHYTDTWLADDAIQKAYFFNDSSRAWADPFPTGNGNVYAVKKPAGDWTNVIFVRCDPNGYNASNPFADGSKWNQTGDLTIGANNYFQMGNIMGQAFAGVYEPTDSSVYIDVTNVSSGNPNWNNANHIAVYFFGDGDTWVNALPTGTANIYKVEKPSGGYTGMIVCNMNQADNNWYSMHEQTVDITIGDFNLITLSAEKSDGKRNVSTGSYTDGSASIAGGVMTGDGSVISSSNIALLRDNGPKNLLYLGSHQALIFTLSSGEASVPSNTCRIGAKAIHGVGDAKLAVYAVNSDNTMTELCARTFTGYEDGYCTLSSGTDLKGKTVMIYNSGTDPIALSNLRTTAAVTLGFSNPEGWRSLRLLRRMQQGELEPIPAEPDCRFTDHSLSLDGEIGVNFYFTMQDVDPAEATVELRWADKAEAFSLGGLTPDANGKYQITARVSAKEMTDEITVTLKRGDETLASDVYSVAAYANRILENKDGEFDTLFAEPGKLERLQTLCRAMLLYGARAQVVFDYNNTPEMLADTGLADKTLDALTDGEIAQLGADGENDLRAVGLCYVGSTLLLRASTTYRLYFRVTDAQKFAALTVLRGDETLLPAVNGSYVCYDVAGLSATQITDDVTLRFGVTEDGAFTETCSATFNAGSYIRGAIAGEQALVQTVTALYRYNRAAIAYFDGNGGD